MLARYLVVRMCSAAMVMFAGAAMAASVSAAAVDPPLIEAVKRQDAEAVKRLLGDGVEVDGRQPDGATALHWAVYREDLETVDLLIRAGASVDAVNRLGATPLWLAAGNGDASVIARLLDAGANPNVALLEGETPVMTAARSGTAEGVRLLIEAGADVNARETSREQTALMWAVTQGQHRAVQVLLEARADVEARSKVRPRLMYDVSSNGAVFDQGVIESLGGFTPLLFAARHGDVESARLLLAAGVDVDNPAANGTSPLVVATHSGHMAFAVLLLAEGAEPDAIGAGYTALHAAVLRGDLTTVEALLARGADPNIRLEKGTPLRRTSEDWALRASYVSATPFWLAASFREPAIMRALAAAGADPTLTTTERWRGVVERAGGVGPARVVGGFVTPVMAAVRGSSDRGRFFLYNDDPVAEERRALEAVTVAADLGVDIDAADHNGTAAVHDAAARNLPTVVRFLAERGAALDVKNAAGRTPLALAITASRRPRIVNIGPEWKGETAVDVLRELGAEEPARSPAVETQPACSWLGSLSAAFRTATSTSVSGSTRTRCSRPATSIRSSRRRAAMRRTAALHFIVVAVMAVGCASPASEPDAPMEDAVAEEAPVDPTAIRPFEIAVPDAVLEDLRARLARTRLPDQLEGADWDYGTELDYLTEFITYWRDEFDWREQERRLNQFDQFKTVIDDLDIHFIHQRSPEPDAVPLIITHGWPGSIAEFTKIIGPLTDPVAHGGQAEDAFHVVAPSMPGYGFSDKPRTPGFGPEQIAEVNAALMARLGYDRYGIQGGDWGSIISQRHAFNHPDQAIGLHVNMVTAGPPSGVDDPTAGVPPEELERSQARRAFYTTAEAGYSRIQGTKPQTLGYALNDSPAGQAAWIVEKFRAWCDCNGDPETIFTRDELLTNITIYWVTQTATSSARLYYESGRAPTSGPMGRIEVPTGVAIFPYELFISPRKWAEAQYNITHWTEMPRGGHFAALEQPELLVEDLREFFRPLRGDGR